ncbi:MAG: hypothetical protein WCF31_02280 [Candidatus Deferrimicrobiaceae bacterium]
MKARIMYAIFSTSSLASEYGNDRAIVVEQGWKGNRCSENLMFFDKRSEADGRSAREEYVENLYGFPVEKLSPVFSIG